MNSPTHLFPDDVESEANDTHTHTYTHIHIQAHTHTHMEEEEGQGRWKKRKFDGRKYSEERQKVEEEIKKRERGT